MEPKDDKTESSAQPSQEQPATESEESITFEKLTPTCLSDDEMQGYSQALDFIFQENDLLNIAITGPYASGKSSVIKTYEKKLNELNIFKKLKKLKKLNILNIFNIFKKLNGIHISLAYFSPTLESKIKGKKKVDELIFEDELMLERKIINQLVHQIDPDKIPATEFKLKSESKKWSNRFWAVVLSIMISCLIFIDKGSLINSQDEYSILALLSLFLFLCLTALVINKIINLQNSKNLISKLKIFQNEIDMSSSACEVSYFDKYLNEIIYILNKSQLDYIVFEDIDRYDDNLILNKLRELNYIYNKKYGKNNPKPIKFFYLIKDEIFESKDRTKFFDYILPIVPVMDNANSLGKMEQIFEERNIRKDFSITLLDTLSSHLDDIRTIKNICNEYIIYKTRIAHNGSWFKKENLLAIIVYKNIFPADFSLTRLGLGQGVVHRIIDSLEKQKNEYCQKEINKINDEIDAIKEKVASNEKNKSLRLYQLLASKLCFREMFDCGTYQYVGVKDIFSLEDKVEQIKIFEKNHWRIANQADQIDHSYQEIHCKEYVENIQKEEKYLQEKYKIEIYHKNKKAGLDADIKKLAEVKEKKQQNLPKKISEFIRAQQNKSVEALFEEHTKGEDKKYVQYKDEYKKLSSSCYFPLLRDLIIQGYIDEFYSDYTSTYDAQGLPPNDTLFLRNIYERGSSDSTFWRLKLKKSELVLERLKKYKNTHFNRESVLNYSLLDYSLATSNVYKLDNLSLFISLLEPLHDNQVLFINAYLERYSSFLREERMTLAPVRKNTDIILQKLSEIQIDIQIEIQNMETVLPLISVKERISQRAKEAQVQKLEAQARTLEAQELKAEAQKLKAEAQELKAEAQAEAQELKAKAQAKAQELQAEAQKLKAQAQELKAEAQELKAEAQKLKAEAQKLKAEAQKLKAQAQELEAQAQGLDAQAQGLDAQAQGLEAQAQAQEALALAQAPLGIEELAQVQTQALEALALALEKLEQAQDTLVIAKQEARYKPEYLGLLIQQLNQQFPLLWQKIQEQFFDQKLYFYLLFIYSDDLSTLSEINKEQTFKERINNSADFLLIKDEWCNILNLNGRFSTGIGKISIAFEELGIKFKKIDQSTPRLLEVIETGNHYELNQANVQHILENLYAHENFATHMIQTLLALNKDVPIKSYFQRNPEKLVLSITASDITPINDNEDTVLFVLNHKCISPEAKIAYIDKLSTAITELNQITDEEIREKLRQKQK